MMITFELPDRLQDILIIQLIEIRRVLEEYKLAGGAGLNRVVDSAIGTLIRYRDDLQSIEKEEDKKIVLRSEESSKSENALNLEDGKGGNGMDLDETPGSKGKASEDKSSETPIEKK